MTKGSAFLLLTLILPISTQVLAGPQKPLVLKQGQVRQIQAGDTIQASAATASAASVNIPQGVSPTFPADGDLWVTPQGFYARINGATLGPFAQSASPQNFTNASPVFASGQYNSGFQFLANGADPGLWYNNQQHRSYATDALTSAILVPASATVHQANGIASYIHTLRAQPANGGDVAAYFQGECAAPDCAVFSLNTVASDSAGMTGQKIGVEIDNNVNSSDTTVNGINLVLSGNLVMSGYANGYTCRVGYGPIRWNTCLNVDDGAVSGYPVFIGSTGKGNGVDSMRIGFRGRDSSGTQFVATIYGSKSGNLELAPGADNGSVDFTNANGENYASISAKSFSVNRPLQLPGYTVSTLPACNADLKGGYAHATDIAAVAYNTIPVGGGTNDAPVYCDGINWKMH